MYKSDDCELHRFIKKHGDFVINKWLSYHDNKSFEVKTFGIDEVDEKALRLFTDTMNHLGYDILLMSNLMHYHYDELHNNLFSRKSFRMHILRFDRTFDAYNSVRRSDIKIEDEVTVIRPDDLFSLEYEFHRICLKNRETGELVKITSEIYPLDIENEVHIGRSLGDYLQSNKCIKVKSYARATMGFGFVGASITVKLPTNFVKYYNFASCKDIVSNTYNHYLNGSVYNSNPVHYPRRYSPTCLEESVLSRDDCGQIDDEDIKSYFIIFIFIMIVISLFYYGVFI